MYDRDRVLDSVDLAALADELLGPRRGTARSGTWVCPSPNHAQTGRTPPVSVFTARRGEQRWRCHGCGAGGSAIDLVMACHHVDVRGALDELARRSDVRSLQADRLAPSRRAPDRPQVARPEAVTALDAYVRSCAERLWQPAGRRVLLWLTDERGLPEAVLRVNLVGADPGPARQPRPDGVPNTAGAVFPCFERGRAVYAQLRRLDPGAGQRWLSVAGRLVPNPKVTLYRPASRSAREPVIITEGPIDALSACAAGYRSAAVLGATVGDGVVAARLARLPGPLVIAFDRDHAGRAGTDALAARLADLGRHPARLEPPAGVSDLNEWHQNEPRWHERFRESVGGVIHQRADRTPVGLA